MPSWSCRPFRSSLLAPLLVLLASAFAQGEDAPYRWEQITPAAPFSGRDGAGILSYRGRMWLLGGWNPRLMPRKCENSVWSTTNGADWELVKPNTFIDQSFDPHADWEGRHTAGSVVFQDRMWIVGGDPLQGHDQSDIWSSTDGKTWNAVLHNAPWGPRALPYTLVHNNKIWVIGGQTMPQFAPGEEHFYRDIWTSSDGVTWEQTIPQEPCWSQRGMIGGSAVLHGRIWVLGGGTYDTPQRPQRLYFNDVWSSADGIKWTQHTAQAPWHIRQYHSVAAWDDKLWVVGGFHETHRDRNDVWYSANGSDWHELPATPWSPRHATSLVVHNDALWVIAGSHMQPDVWRLSRSRK